MQDAMEHPRYLLFGLGAAGASACAALLGDGAEIVGAFTRSSHVDEDLGKVVGRDPCGLAVSPVADFTATRGMADVAIFSTTSALKDLLGPAKECLEAGINVLTITEDALYPWDYDPATAAELDAAGKAGGATLMGTGVNDVIMARLPVLLAGLVHGAERIEVECTGDFGAFGPELLKLLQIGARPEDYSPAAHEGQDVISRQCARMIAGLAGLHVISEDVRLEPTTASVSLPVAALDMVLEPGQVTGSLETAALDTAEGVEIEVRLIGKVFEPGEEEYAVATVHTAALTEPVRLRVSPLPGIEATAGIALSRVPDVLAAPPGFPRAEDLPDLRFRSLAQTR
jgi:2,4-diaminopentanoate dehydrogenase